DTLLETGAYDGHNFYYFVPGLLEQFRAQDINALIAPRPHLSLAGTRDKFTQPAGLDRIDAAAREAYAAAGAPDNWKQLRYDAGHEETPEMRQAVLEFLRKRL